MENSINALQNEARNLDCLAAQRELYSSAKRICVVQLLVNYGLVAAGVLVGAAVAFAVGANNAAPAWIVGGFGIVALFGGQVLRLLVERRVSRAAKIQEMFDCEVLDLPWNAHLAGGRVEMEFVAYHASKFDQRGGDRVPLKDWYSGHLDEIPLCAARLICQRQNLTWDRRLRELYAWIIGLAGAAVLSLILIMGLLRGISLEEFIVGMLVPAAPVIAFASQEIADNLTQIGEQRRLRDMLAAAWEQMIRGRVSKTTADTDARRIQDCILMIRRSAPLILDRLYWCRRRSQERESLYTAEDMVRQYREHRLDREV